ncbi:MAG: dimethylarginine dimethylaminohydrolase [Pseudomonadota bacterium]
MSVNSYTFSHAITRAPAATIANGLRTVDTGTPELSLFSRHHADYRAALESTGATVVNLAALDAYPDSVFVEDAALCLPEVAIVMRPGAPSRFGEAVAIAPTLTTFYDMVCHIEGPGFIEGGDILVTEREIFVGRSARTDIAGANELGRIVSQWGYKIRMVEMPSGILHFKTDCALLDEETILSTLRLSEARCFDNYKVIHTADGEEACANCIRFNNLVIVPDGYPRTAEKISHAGFEIRMIGNSEAAKLDGGMSCLSLRFSPTK